MVELKLPDVTLHSKGWLNHMEQFFSSHMGEKNHIKTLTIFLLRSTNSKHNAKEKGILWCCCCANNIKGYHSSWHGRSTPSRSLSSFTLEMTVNIRCLKIGEVSYGHTKGFGTTRMHLPLFLCIKLQISQAVCVPWVAWKAPELPNRAPSLIPSHLFLLSVWLTCL